MSTPVALRSMAYENGLKLTAKGRHVEAIEQFERALVERPNDARVLFALGNTARALGLAQPAEEFYRRVLAQDPVRVEALVNLANLLRTNGQFSAAEALLAPALKRNPEAPELWLTRGSVFRETGDYASAAIHYRQALALRPDYAAALSNLADLQTDAGETQEALALYDQALRSEPTNPQARLNRAVLHLLNGNLQDGWRDYAARLKLSGKAPVAEHKLTKWDGASLRRTRLLVTAEQGVGDQVMFASVIPELSARAANEGGSVILECEPRLVQLLSRSFPSVAVHPSDHHTRAGVTHARYEWLRRIGGANAFIEMGSLPRHLRPNLSSFPATNNFLQPDGLESVRWGGFLASVGRGPFIGVCWRSGKTTGHRALQYAPLEAWAAFLATLPGTLISAQYDATSGEIDTLQRVSGREIFVPPNLDQKQELDRTAAMLSSLDALVTAPTAVAWFAAGTGVDTYKMLYDTSWTSFGRAYEPFAPSCHCVMPTVRGDWANTFDKARSLIMTRY